MKFNKLFLLSTLVLSSCGNSLSQAATPEQPFLHPLFTDHVVLQRGPQTPVWGWSAPDSTVVVQFADQVRTTKTARDGRWEVKLRSLRSSAEPRILTVTNLTTHQSARVADVLVGDVWLCSGQSNMEMGIAACNATNDIATADYPQIRLLTVPRLVAPNPVSTLDCHWLPCQPDTVAQGLWGGFSAVGFFFGRELHHELNIPIGLIHSSWGGTIAEAWTSKSGLEPLGDFKSSLAQLHAMSNAEATMHFSNIYEQWCCKKDTGTQQHWESQLPDQAWQTVPMPQAFEQAGLPGYDGIVWFRREFELPENWLGQPLILTLGVVDDFDTTWVNGVKLGSTYRFDRERRYAIPAKALRSGKNVITIRVLDTGGVGGLTGQAAQLQIVPEQNDLNPAALALAGEWQMRPSQQLAQLTAVPQSPDTSNPNRVTVLYNGMIAPLLPFAIKGVIWYQGESNADRALQYRRLLPALIADWRRHFGVGDFPFYIVQLAAFQTAAEQPRDHSWAELREAQALTAAAVRNSGLTVAMDVGDAKDIHPKDKLTVGHRLALCALAQTYGKPVEFSGPNYRSMKPTRTGFRLKFDHAKGGLLARGGQLTGFAIAGADRKFVWATAVIEGETVFVSSPQVTQPVAVRYGWDINSNCNLFNQVGLPAIPFRTDTWPGVTK